MNSISRMLIIAGVIASSYFAPLYAEDLVACTMEYAPVCGAKQVQCVTTPCDPIAVTYGNMCQLNADKATFVSTGECVSAPNQTPRSEVKVSERISTAVRTAINKAFKPYMMTDGSLNATGILVAQKVITRVKQQLSDIHNELIVSIYTPEGHQRVIQRAALLQLIHDTIQQLVDKPSVKADPSCKLYFDGCNTCTLMENGERACTKKYCETPSKPYCMDK